MVLQTPYGIASSSFMAVGRDHKLGKKGKVVKGKVGHDRIQSASGKESIARQFGFGAVYGGRSPKRNLLYWAVIPLA